MSKMFRPVKEVWGTATDCFTDPESLEMLLCELGDASLNNYGEYRSVWIQEGQAFLDLIKKKNLITRELPEQIRELIPDEYLKPLLQNLRSLAKEWKDSLDPVDGSLTFYIDQN